ncbi:hypothetical protein H072_11524 [Dactylellina haptotyla CBS 200.50]|uniref:Uncharacterized protein n=1 Tax=Dactylellina haptotyla (strain CBS 200.50) TaxID=1284197 RepID=S7ZWD2_DACHA|nr:hypothetical protein H072_11524 [Dactylellina haptotyla CBS 200.50]
MSSGGYYKYRCKYFYSHNCPNWVWVNNSTCAECAAAGRDSLSLSSQTLDSNAIETESFVERNSACYSASELSLRCSEHDPEDREFNDEAPARPRRHPCNHFHSGYL